MIRILTFRTVGGRETRESAKEGMKRSRSFCFGLEYWENKNKLQVSERKGMFMTKSILAAIASLLIANVAPAETSTPSLPDGDQFIATLAQDVDNVASACTLFKRCINENRPAAETLKAADVLSAGYRHLCLDVMDFESSLKYWKEFSAKPSDFSVAAQERMPELRSRGYTLLLNSIHDVEDALKKPEWKDDPRMREVAHSMTLAYNMAKNQIEKK